MANEIQYVGLKNLTDHESSAIKRFSSSEFDKIVRDLKDARLRIAVKTINPDGNARTYEITALLDSAKGRFEVNNSGWNLSVVIHELFESLHNRIKKRLKLKD